MSRLPPDARAFRQGIGFTLLAFVIGAAGVFIVVVWLSLVSDPNLEWFEILRVAASAWWISVLVGLAAAAGMSVIHSRWYFRKGFVRCPYCDKPRKGIDIECDCPGFRAFKAACKQEGTHT